MSLVYTSRYPDLLPRSIRPGVDQNLIRKRIRIGRGNGWNMSLFAVGNINDLHGGVLQALLHLLAIPRRLGFTARRSESDAHPPVLPHCLLVRFGHEPTFPSLLLEELQDQLAPCGLGLVLWRRLRGGGLDLAKEDVGALFDRVFDFVFRDVGERYIEDVMGCGDEGREDSVEEDGVEDACASQFDVRSLHVYHSLYL